MRSAALFMVTCACATAQTSAIEGIAIDSVTRQPIAGVHISLAQAPADDAVLAYSYGAKSQPDGRFSIARLPPSIYFVGASRPGYLQMPGAERTLELKPGEQRTGFTIEMTPRATIAGRVTDESGDPIENAQVEALPAGAGAQARNSMSDRTDERGQFRMIGAPGKYYVKVEFDRQPLPSPEIRDDGAEPVVYGTTYYPAADGKQRASLVEVAAGGDLTGIDVQLVRKRSLTISGQITGIPDHAPNEFFFANVLLSAIGEQRSGFNSPSFSNAAQDGKFMLAGVAPGRYRLVGNLQNDTRTMRSAPVEVNLDTSSVDSVILKLHAAEVLSGSVELSGGPRPVPVPNVGLRLEAADQLQTQTGETDAAGAFHVDQVFPEKYKLHVQGLPENTYVRSVRLDDAEISGDEVDLSRGVNGARLKIEIAAGAGSIQGRVVGKDGEPSRATFHLVILASASGEFDQQNLRPVGPGEKFQFAGLRPGKYRLLAIDIEEQPGGLRAAEMSLVKGLEVEVHEGESLTKDIQATAVENSDAAR